MQSTRRARTAGGLVGLAAMAAALLTPTAATAAEDLVLDHGHIDAFNVAYQGGALALNLKEDVTGSDVVHDPENVTLVVKEQAWVGEIPEGYPGAPAGYVLPMSQDQNLIWPGWSTETLGSSGYTDVDIRVESVEGPGDVTVFQNGGFGEPRPVLDGGGYQLPGTISVPAPAHVHTNWVFASAGVYDLTVSAVGTNPATGASLTTDTQVYTFVVGDQPDPVETTLAIEGLADGYTVGDTIALTAVATPATELDHWHWFTRDGDAGEWVAVDGQTTSSLNIPATADLDGKQVIARLYGDDHAVVAESAPVTLEVVAAAPQPSVTITGLGHHYHSTYPVELTAEPAAIDGDVSYRWELQRADQSAFAPVAEFTGAEFSAVAEPALHAAQVRVVAVVDGEDVATSAAVTIDVDDHGNAPARTIEITGIGDDVQIGDVLQLQAGHSPATVLSTWQWVVTPSGGEPQVQTATGPNLQLTVTEELNGAAVVARVVDGTGAVYTESLASVIAIDDGGIPATELGISTNRAADDYWYGQTATLTATQSVPTGLTEYVWLQKAPGADGFTPVAGKTSEIYSFKPGPALDGVQVKVQLLHEGEVHAESDVVTISGKVRPVATTITISGDSELVIGQSTTFTSAQSPETGIDHFHWYTKAPGTTDWVWVDQSRESTVQLLGDPKYDGAQLVIRLFDETHAVIAESAPLTLSVTEGEEPVETDLTITGLAQHYHTGDTAELTAVQTPATDEDHYHWFIKRVGDEQYTVISGALSDTLEHVVAEGDHGASIIARLYDHDHAVIAESDPVVLTIDDHHEAPVKPGTPPGDRDATWLEGVPSGGLTVSDDTPVEGQKLTIDLGAARAGQWVAVWLFSEPQLLGGDWLQADADGRLAVTLPAGITGAHQLAGFDAAGSLIGWQQLQIGAVTPAGQSAELGRTGVELGAAVPVAVLLMLLGAGAVVLHRRRAAN